MILTLEEELLGVCDRCGARRATATNAQAQMCGTCLAEERGAGAELLAAETARQDFVDNGILELVMKLRTRPLARTLSSADIADIRDAIELTLEEVGATTEMEFYPFVTDPA
jgi:hypothetical protein